MLLVLRVFYPFGTELITQFGWDKVNSKLSYDKQDVRMIRRGVSKVWRFGTQLYH